MIIMKENCMLVIKYYEFDVEPMNIRISYVKLCTLQICKVKFNDMTKNVYGYNLIILSNEQYDELKKYEINKHRYTHSFKF